MQSKNGSYFLQTRPLCSQPLFWNFFFQIEIWEMKNGQIFVRFWNADFQFENLKVQKFTFLIVSFEIECFFMFF
jgi:hypothetical protein